MPEHDHEHDTDDTGSATSGGELTPEGALAAGDTPTEATSSSTSEGEAGGEAGEESGPFGGLSPAEASRRRWEAARRREADPEAADPRKRMAQQLQLKAEKGDLRAYEAWRQITDELEAERLARDGTDGARAWESITPEQRRLLLSVLSGEAVVLEGEEAARWREQQGEREEVGRGA